MQNRCPLSSVVQVKPGGVSSGSVGGSWYITSITTRDFESTLIPDAVYSFVVDARAVLRELRAKSNKD